MAANVVSPANDFSSLAPRQISYVTGGLITAVIGIVMMPWKLYADAAAYIFTWLIGYSSLMGAIGGILIADYWVLRRRQLSLADLFKLDGRYTYRTASTRARWSRSFWRSCRSSRDSSAPRPRPAARWRIRRSSMRSTPMRGSSRLVQRSSQRKRKIQGLPLPPVCSLPVSRFVISMASTPLAPDSPGDRLSDQATMAPPQPD